MIKKFKKAYLLYKKNKKYNFKKGIKILLKIINYFYKKCITSIDITINLNLKIIKNRIIKDIINLPYNNGKKYKFLIFTNNKKHIKYIRKFPIKYYIGDKNYINKIKNGWKKFNILITIPYFMKKLIPLSTILGVKNLMPNPRLGHITDNPIYIINEIINKGRIEYKMDKFGIINCSIARSNYNYKKIKCNMIYFLKKLLNNNNLNNNINIIKNIFISSTYSPSIKIKKIW